MAMSFNCCDTLHILFCKPDPPAFQHATLNPGYSLYTNEAIELVWVNSAVSEELFLLTKFIPGEKDHVIW